MENSESGDDLHPNFQNDSCFVVLDEGEDDGDQLTAENTDDSNYDGHDEKLGLPLREQDRFLPIANVAKIMKKAIPDSGKIAKDARECVQECVSEFISFITSEASDRCHMEKRKTINGEDILFAMTALGFDNYVEPLKLYLQKYREATKGDRNLPENEIAFVDGGDETFNAQINENTISGNQSEAVIYAAFSDQMPQFQLNLN